MTKYNYNKYLYSMRKILFFTTTGLIGIFVVPVLGLISFGFFIGAIGSFLSGILRTFGVPWVKIEIPYLEVPNLWSIPFTIMFSIVFIAIAWYSYKLLKMYFRYTSFYYRKVIN